MAATCVRARLGSLYHLPHGQVCGALLPWVMEFNTPAAREQYARLMQAIGICGNTGDLLDWISGLVGDLGAAVDFAQAGLNRDDFARIIPPTLASGSTKHNPRPVDEPALRALLERLIA